MTSGCSVQLKRPSKSESRQNSMSHLNADQKEELRAGLYKIISKYKSIKIIAVVVDIKKVYELSYVFTQNDLYWYAYKQMTERFQYYLQDLSRIIGGKINDIIICDHRMPKDDDQLRHLHQNLLQSNKPSSAFYQNLIEGVFMAPSHLSVGIQFADLVTGAVYRKISRNDNRFFEQIENSFRKRPDGKIEGYGFIKLPK
ncbi:DUF3800 domain-containing protein [Spirobacillus cienkowskii]|uniref:DUF3800 domain-containing protein n=1 Tax=Spirobacillus cienkowskii TaxID=495820 RepID=UPI0030CEDBF8